LWRAQAFADLGADIVFVEAPRDEREMERVARCTSVSSLVNMLEQGATPILPPAQLESMGFKIAAYPLTLLNSALGAMQRALTALKEGQPPERLMSFDALKELVGFEDYYAEEARYSP
jgi:2-methylisocitrate lyase-like PEP mutase family enzyme